MRNGETREFLEWLKAAAEGADPDVYVRQFAGLALRHWGEKLSCLCMAQTKNGIFSHRGISLSTFIFGNESVYIDIAVPLCSSNGLLATTCSSKVTRCVQESNKLDNIGLLLRVLLSGTSRVFNLQAGRKRAVDAARGPSGTFMVEDVILQLSGADAVD